MYINSVYINRRIKYACTLMDGLNIVYMNGVYINRRIKYACTLIDGDPSVMSIEEIILAYLLRGIYIYI